MTAPAPAAAETPACPDIDGLAAELVPGATLVLGEIHGTVEIPRFVGDVACHAARRGPVVVALEIPSDEQARLDAFLRSRGADADVAALLAGPFWARDVQDGRSSEAMLALLRRLRAARAAGAAVTALAFDVPASHDGDPSARDAAMAARIAEARAAAPDAVVVVLAGNLHSRRRDGMPWDPTFVTMGAHLAARGVAFVTFDVERAGGAAWVCVMDGERMLCGERGRPAREDRRRWYVERADGVDGHDGRYGVGATTASPPALAPPLTAE